VAFTPGTCPPHRCYDQGNFFKDRNMGSFSIWHWLILLVFLASPLFLGLLVWWLVRIVQKRSGPRQR